ncbi:endonuclease/exonuclease/phosphatase family protein [Oligoflexus tunisiensis]|uniref:endonuclease/exonuclease/phosphatase family protein n=1 Tax=Oligoflexus tunisiensis TaxID=708132 RepID=UPI00159F326F|nr:endonuclease/exonuclease/phosphatase family protein [Oligoflexus tunisiensis]
MSPFACLACIILLGSTALNAQTDDVSLRFLTYNVAGLPEPISASSPAKNSPKIGALINSYDVVLVQEDFNYHNKLSEAALHPYQSKTSGWAGFGDGLNAFSKVPFQGLERIKWKDCHGVITQGSDCLTPKGIMFARYEITPGVTVDVYDLHADAGSDEGSMEARRSNITQLLDLIQERSGGRAVVVVGDFNSRYTRNGDIAEHMVQAGFQDSWMVWNDLPALPSKGPALNESCAAEPAGAFCELIDKIYFRGSDDLDVSLMDYHVPFDVFVDAAGKPLSDHLPVAAELRFRFHQD